MKLRLLPNFISKLRKHHFSNSSCKNNVLLLVQACEKISLSTTPANSTRRIRSILGTKSVNELLCLVGNTKREFESAEVTASCQKLSEHVLQVLKLQPWAVADEKVLWYQSKINTGAIHHLCQVLRSSEFSLILQNVRSHIGTLTCTQLLTVTKSLLDLHVPVGNDVMSALLHQCIQRHHDFSLAELATFSIVGNKLHHSGIPLLCNVAQALQVLVAELSLWNNLDDFNSISTILSNISIISSKSFLEEQLLPGFKELFCKYDYQTLAVHMDEILSCSVSFRDLLANPIKHSGFVKTLVGFFVHHLDTLSLWHLQIACTLINKLSSMTESLSDLFQKRAFEFQRHKWLSSSDVMNIIQIADNTVWNETLITKTVNALENVLIDFDVQLLQFLAKTTFLKKLKDNNITHQFSQCVMVRLPDVANDKPCLKSILELFSSLHYKDKLFHHKMINFLVGMLQFDQMGLMPGHVGYIFKYIISCGRFAYLPKNLKKNLMQMMHQFPLGTVHNLAYQVHCQSFICNYDKSLEIQQFAIEMKKSVLKRSSEVESLETLNLFLDTFSRKPLIKESDAVDFSELYDKHAHTVDSISLKWACRLLQEHKLLAPQALQCFADFMISTMDYQNNLSLLLLYLETCAVLNFCPTNISNLEQLITKELIQKYTHMDSEIHLSTVLSYAWNLAILEVFPMDLFNLVFSLEFLKTFDAVCQGASSFKRQKYEDQLYSLNRSVCLDCPHLKIPLFYKTLEKGSACRYPSSWNEFRDRITVQHQLHVEEILGGPEYFKANQLSPYFYRLDFECMLTKCGLPVPTSNWTKLSNLQRTAILLLHRTDCCRNIPQVLGPVAMKLRHLEIMGYRVVQVPYDKLHSDDSPMTHEDVTLKHILSESLFGDYCHEENN